MVSLLMSGSSINNEELQNTLHINSVTESEYYSYLGHNFYVVFETLSDSCVTQETTFPTTSV